MSARWDETWHRLREWTSGQGPAERLAAQVIASEGYAGIDPSHPLGGRDGGRDASIVRDGKPWIMAAYFPRGQQTFGTIKEKFVFDHGGVAANKACGMAFVTNQEITLGQRGELAEFVETPIDLFHLERVTSILDRPGMSGVREQFLAIESADSTARPPASTARDVLDAAAPPPGAPSNRSIYDGMLMLRVVVAPVTQELRDPEAGNPRRHLESASNDARAVGSQWPEAVSLLAKRLGDGWEPEAAHHWGAGRTNTNPMSLARTPTAAASYLTRGAVVCVERTWPTGIHDDAGVLAYYAAREPEVAAELVVGLSLAESLLKRLPVAHVDLVAQVAAAPMGTTLVASRRAVSGGRFGNPAGYLPQPVQAEVPSHYLDNLRVTIDELEDSFRCAERLIGPWLATFRDDDLMLALRE